jgi:hypothetical protein
MPSLDSRILPCKNKRKRSRRKILRLRARRPAYALSAALAFALAFAGCSEKTNFAGESMDVLEEVLAKANSLLEDADKAPSGAIEAVESGTVYGMLGIAVEQYAEWVDNASSSVPPIHAIAHQISVIKCREGKAADVKKAVASGFDARKWICVMPEEAVVLESGPYVLLCASSKKFCDAAVGAFSELGGEHGTPLAFFDSGSL